ncbi:Holliday junction branch migration protein RuvA [Polyangium sp. 6x1]|uniref:Holliday junction branch migration protein RuvA n=1 Tax=Polyangium sp. 6x1 TaxID=3042689 RepID=UPI00248313D6|nr:Holliday junction branch migration protein RuvA [Polyangium sp. 6x1]MDI1446731.1 Holliday junction branch migration protein RuvA [Polyangium sp. 6x1]
MIGRLTGRIVEDSAEGVVVIDVGGVGYEVTVPLGALGRASREADDVVTLYVHTHVREDTFALYGFPTRDDRAAFRSLIGVSSIGPKIAMSILGALPAGELAAAIARGEASRLVAVPGVGKKTAERLILELKGKLAAAPVVTKGVEAPRPTAPEGKAELLQGALTRMGFRPAEADRAVTALGARVQTEPLGDLVREALALLSSK